ncbi:zinc transporter ZIP6-like [Amphiura filiformis]|uniref:zinc transporter ZIP6-like n=1 Tax=Amphiura filiformis TaxID=82378 RepID=UPI003B2199FA
MDEPTDPSQTGIPHHIWGYAFAAVTLISMASIVCILVVPCMQRFPKIYSRLLSFLVAMAVGTLSGDAVMHLMPHAFGFHGHKDLEESMILTTPIPGCEPVTSSDHHDHDSGMAISGIDWENNVVIKGLVVLMGIFSFFIIEQLMQLCRSCRQKRHKPGDNGSNYTQLKPRENVGAKLCNHSNATDRLSILADPTAAAQIDALLTTDKQEPTKASVVYKCSDDRRDSQASDASHHSSQHAVTICVHSDAQIHISPNPTYGHHHGDGDHKHKHNDHQQGGEEDGYHEDHHHHHRKNSHDKEVDLHDGHHQGHHGHSHGVPPSDAGIATLAWIVVMGDGLHNFCDGLVVGAAFADSLAGGLSTAIAVMCHELPHELGDFAVMLKAGMSVKQALAFQGVSSILAYLGMAMGVAMGNISMLSLWIFALAAGMFLYIALADLFPEMVDTTSTTKDSKCVHLLLQILGVMFGIGIMLTIGLLEEDLMAALVSRREG